MMSEIKTTDEIPNSGKGSSSKSKIIEKNNDITIILDTIKRSIVNFYSYVYFLHES